MIAGDGWVMSFLNDRVLPRVGVVLEWVGESIFNHWRVYVAVMVTVAVMKGCA